MKMNSQRKKNRNASQRSINQQMKSIALGALESRMRGRKVKRFSPTPPELDRKVMTSFIARETSAAVPAGGLIITPAQIAGFGGALPGTWSFLRVKKITVWGTTTSVTDIAVTWTLDSSRFSSEPTDGQKLCAVSTAPPMDQSIVWYAPTSVTPIATITAVPVNAFVTIDVSLELVA